MRSIPGGGVLCAVAVAAALGCAGAEVARGERKGAPWRELATEHFVLRTDISSDSARRLVEQLEVQRALLVQALPALAAVEGRLDVYALSSREEYWEATGQRSDYIGHAHLREGGQRYVVLFVSPSGVAEDQTSTVAHELAHALLWQVVPSQPRWFSEGFAGYLESVARERGGKRWVGLRANHYEEIDPLPVRELFSWRQAAHRREWRYYQSAFVLVRYLDAEQPAGFAELQRRLAAGEDGEAAWNAAFPRWSLTDGAPAELDRILRARAQDKAGTREVSAAVAVTPSERLLSASEEHTVRLTLPVRWTPALVKERTEAALAVDPRHPRALQVIADAAEGDGVALALARSAVAAHPEDPRSWVYLAWYLPAERSAEREAALRRALELAPDDPLPLARLSSEIVLENPEEASRLAVRARDLAPWSTLFHAVAAAALSRQGRCEEARAEVRFARTLATDLERLEAMLQAAGELCGAPGERAGRLGLDAGWAITQGRLPAALRLADAVLARFPDDPTAWNQRGRVLDRTGRLAEAEEAYRRAVRSDPKHPHAWGNLGLVLRGRGRPAEAIDAFRRQAEVAPDRAFAHRELGLLLLQEGRAAEAISPLARAAVLEPKEPAAPFALGRAHLALGQARRAVEAFERGLSLRRSPYWLNEAAWALAEANAELDRAAAWAEAAVAGHARHLAELREWGTSEGEGETTRRLGNAWDTLGWVRFRQGKLAEAERWIASAERLHPSAVVSAHLGELLERAERRPEAIAAYARAVALDPKSGARARLEQLAGAGGVVGATSRARAELQARRTLAGAAAAPVDAGAELELVLAADGAVAQARTRSGVPVPAVREALRAARHEIPFPDPAVPFLVVNATWQCAGGTCAAVLGGEP